MVKAQKEKKGRRSGPAGLLPEAITQQEQQQEQQQQQSVPQIIQQLTSKDSSEREWACQAISNITIEKTTAQILIKNDVVRKLTQNFADPLINIKVAAAGALRNLAIDGGDEICTEMIKKDVMTPLLTYTHQGIEEMKKFLDVILSTDLQEHKEKLLILLDNCLSIMWSLCENSEKGTEYLNSDAHLLNHVLLVMSWNHPECKKLSLTAAQLLATLSEENESILNQFKQDAVKCQFMVDYVSFKPNQDENYFLNLVLGAGIIYNVREAISKLIGRNVMVIVLPVLLRVLKPNLSGMIRELLSGEFKLLLSEVVVVEKEQPSQAEKFQKEMDVWMKTNSLINSQQFALELLANICTVDSSEEWAEDEMTDENTEVEMTDDELTETFKMVSTSDVVLQSVLEKAQFMDNTFYNTLNETEKGRDIINRLSTNQVRAVDCLNNIALVASSDSFPHSQDIFNNLFQIALSVGNFPLVDQIPLLEAITSSIFSLLREHKVNLNDVQINAILAAATVSSSETVRTNSVGIIGKFSKDTNNLDLVSRSTKVLLQSSRDQSPWIVCESLNSIFDIFSDNDRNQAYVKENVQEELKKIFQQLSQLIKGIPKKSDIFGRMDETLLNLKRFIEYKSNPNN